VNVYTDVVRYWDLFRDLFRRDLQVRYRSSLLGVAWTLINPLVLMGV
jgi:lipopolysaccharide transport system permease protein